MNIFVAIPAYNEEHSIADVITSIPRKIRGVNTVKVIVWDDGSTDKTGIIAKKAGADYLFRNKRNLGLARTFSLVTKKAISLGADIVVTTDADNQYKQQEIVQLVAPILIGDADVVNGNRQIEKLTHMPHSKKYGNMIGSVILRYLTGLQIQDASSGFRAYNAKALTALKIFANHTYTHETLIQLAFSDFAIVDVPVTFHARKKGDKRSRLIQNVPQHMIRSGITIIRAILMYRPLPTLLVIGSIELFFSFLIGIRFLYFYFLSEETGHIQSLILSSMLLTLGLTTILIGFLADLLSINRKILLEKDS